MSRLFLFLLMVPCAAFAEAIRFQEDFPDLALRGKVFDVPRERSGRVHALMARVYLKEIEIDAFVKSLPPVSKNWREEAERWNQLRREKYDLLVELRSLVAG